VYIVPMFLERHSTLIDDEMRYLLLDGMKDLPGWKQIGQWQEKDGHLECSVGWMATFDAYYMDFLGRIGEGRLQIQGRGQYYDGDQLKSFEKFPIPRPIGPPLQNDGCIIS